MPTWLSYEGDCHCGAAGFVYRTAIPPERWSVRACQCSFCRRHGALSTSDPRGTLTFVEHEPGALTRYRFALKTADFLICRHCGVYLGAMMHTESGSYGIANVLALPGLLDQLPDPQPMVYDREGQAGRQSRREERWTPIASR